MSILILSNIFLILKKFFVIKDNKLMLILANFLAKPLYKKQNKIIDEILDISIKTGKIYEININSESGNIKGLEIMTL